MVEEPLKSPNLMNKSLPFMKKAQEDKENNEKRMKFWLFDL